MKRILAALLTWCLLAGLFPVPASAENGSGLRSVPASPLHWREEKVGEVTLLPQSEGTVTQGVYGIQTVPVPILNPMEPLTNRNEILVSGVASLLAEVTIKYGLDRPGAPVQEVVTFAAEETGSGKGKFATVLHLEQDGIYRITASSKLEGQQSAETEPVRVELDRTPPEGGMNFRWNRTDGNQIELHWNPLADDTVDHYALQWKDGEYWTTLKETADDPYYLHSGLPEVAIVQYRLMAVDRAGNQAMEEIIAFTFHERVKEIAQAAGHREGFWNILLSRDGTTAAFISNSGGLPGADPDDSETYRIYAYEVASSALELVGETNARDGTGGQLALSGTGRYIAYEAWDEAMERNALIVYDRTHRIKEQAAWTTEGHFSNVSISEDGSKIVFTSDSTELVPGDTNNRIDVFRLDRTIPPGNQISRINLKDGKEASQDTIQASTSGDGRFTAFLSKAPELLPEGSEEDGKLRLYLYDAASGELKDVGARQFSYEVHIDSPSLSADGNYVAYRYVSQNRGIGISIMDLTSDSPSEVWQRTGLPHLNFGKPRLTDGGRHVYFRYENYNPEQNADPFRLSAVIRFDLRNGTAHRYIGNLAADSSLAWLSGDGSQAVFTEDYNIESPLLDRIHVACLDNCSTPPSGDVVKQVEVTGSQRVHGQLPLASKLFIDATAIQGHSLQAVIKYLSGAEGASQEEIVPLQAAAGRPTYYSGSYTLRPSTKRIVSIGVQPVGKPEVYVPANGFPADVAGRLKLILSASDAALLKGSILSVYSPERGTGRSAKVDESLETAFAVGAAEDYELQVSDQAGRRLLIHKPIAVKNGEETTLSLPILASAQLTVLVKGTRDEPVAGAAVFFRNEKQELVYSGRTDARGAIALKGDHYEKETVQVSVVPPAPYEGVTEQQMTLTAGVNERVVLLNNLSEAVLVGQTVSGGIPLPDIRVTILSQANGTYQILNSDTNGVFTARMAPGNYVIDAKQTVVPTYSIVKPLNVTLEAGKTSNVEIPLVNRGSGKLYILGTATTVDGRSTPLDLSDWRAAAHYSLSVKTGSGAPSYKTFTWNKEEGAAFVPVYGSPGDSFEVCIDGKEAGLTKGCTTSVLDEGIIGTAEVHLEEKSRIVGSVLDVTQVSEFTVTASAKEAPRRSYRTLLDSDGRFSISLPEGGKYEIAIEHQPKQGRAPKKSSYRMTVEVQEGQKLLLPPVSMPAHGAYFEGNAENGFADTELTASFDQSVSLNARYKLLENKPPVSNVALLLHIPDGSELIPGSTVLNGTPVTPIKSEDGVYRVPIGNLTSGKKGGLSYRLRIGQPEIGDLETRLSIEFRKPSENNLTVEGLGTAVVHAKPLTLEAPSRTQRPQIPVSGRALADTSVYIFADEELIGHAVATAGGLWYTKVTLPDKEASGVWNDTAAHYNLVARTERDGSTITTDPILVTFDTSIPSVSEVTLRQAEGRNMTFSTSDGISRFPFVVIPSQPIQFEVKMANAERASRVKIRIGDTEVMAAPDASGVYQAQFPVSPSGTRLGSGIYVSYLTLPKTPVTRENPPTEEEWNSEKNRLPEPWSRNDYSIVNESREGPDPAAIYTPTYRTLVGGKTEVHTRISLTPVQIKGSTKPYRDFSYELDRSSSTFKMTGKVALSLVSPRGAEEALTKAQLGNKDTISTDYVVIALSLAFPDAKAGDLINELNILKTYISDTAEFMSFADQLSEFQDYVINSECNTPMVMDYLKRTEMLYDRASNGLVGKFLLTGIGGVTGSISKIPNKLGNSLSAVLTAFGDGILASWQEEFNELKREFEEEKEWRDRMAAAGAIERCNKKKDEDEDDDDDNDPDDDVKDPKDIPIPHVPGRRDKIADPIWIWDPSGYVYEALPKNRLDGVTTTILMQDPDDPSIWGKWDADWFGQQNPLVTDREGRYGWDVPEGKWRVLYEKDGYLPAQSADLTVLPPHFDVNVPMVSLAPPSVSAGQVLAGSGVPFTFSKYMKTDTVTSRTVFVESLDGEAAAVPVPGRVEAIGPEPDAENVMLAKQFRFVPDAPLSAGRKIRLRVLDEVQSYAKVSMTETRDFELTVEPSDAAPREAVSQAAANGGIKQLLVEWSEDPTVEYDQVRLAALPQSGSCSPVEMNIPKGRQYALLEGLCSGISYGLKLVTVGSNGAMSEGVALNGTTTVEKELLQDLAPPQEVIKPSVTAGKDTLKVQWTDPADPDLRRILVSWKKKDSEEKRSLIYVDPSVQTLLLEGLETATAYDFRIRTTDRFRNTSAGITFSATTQASGGDNHNPGGENPGNGGPGDGGGGQNPGGGQGPGNGGQNPGGGDNSSDGGSDDGSGGSAGGGQAPTKPAPDDNEKIVLEITGDEQAWSGWDDQMRLNIPAGALPHGLKITAQSNARPSSGSSSFPGYTQYGPSILLTAEGPAFPKKPLRLSFRIDPSADASLDLRRLGIYKKDSGSPSGWTYIGGVLEDQLRRLEAEIRDYGEFAVFLFDHPYVDLSQHWSRSDVMVLVSRHIVHGVDEGHFEPDRSITRAEAVTLLMGSLPYAQRVQKPIEASPEFSDVQQGDWYSENVNAAAGLGLVEGANGLFRPNDTVTREELVVLFQRLGQLLGKDQELSSNDNVLAPYNDADQISDWARDAVAEAVAKGILEGVTLTELMPKRTATRAETAVMLLRVLSVAGMVVH